MSVKPKDISLAGRILANFPRTHARAAHPRRPDGARRAGDPARGQHHQAAEHQRLDSAAQGRDQGTAGARATTSPTTPRPQERRRKGTQGALRQGPGQRRQPGPARGQLGPPRRRRGQAVCAQPPAQDGRLVARLEDPRGAHDGRRLLRHREVSTTVERRRTRCASNSSATDGTVTVLKDKITLQAGEVIDATVMSCKALRAFFEAQIEDAKEEGVLFSLHLKATMMKISDPVMFGHAVSVFFNDVFEKHAATFRRLGVNLNNGFGDLLREDRDPSRRQEARRSRPTSQAVYADPAGPGDGEFRQGHHQPACAERHHHRRLHARDDPRLRADVGQGRQAPRHPRR